MKTNPSKYPIWTIPAGSLLHIGGLPYFTTEPTKLEGYGDPVERIKPVAVTGPVEMTSLKNYGFNYELDQKEFAFHVVADSEQTARKMVAAMSAAVYCGELKAQEGVQSLVPALPV